ncbi:MAG: AAA family ATPase [Pseudomonadota bacterium]
MYLEYFGLNEKPFQITPDPRFLYMSRRHRDGFAHLLYGADEAGGFVLLTGEVGTGKTTLCRSALASITDNVRVALILNPKQSPEELIASICDELQVAYPKQVSSIKALIDRLNLYLLKAYGRGERIVVVIDEAQNLSFEVLEQVRLLTNLEVATQKLLQIILIGQPELQTMLSQPELRQLAQRITARFHLTPLTKEETGEYIAHRLKIAGVTREIFTKSAVREIYKLSRGIPRLINTLCERALIGAYGANLPLIKKDIVSNAAIEVLGKSYPKQETSINWLAFGTMAATFVIAVLVLWVVLSTGKLEPQQKVNDLSQIENINTNPELTIQAEMSPHVGKDDAPKVQDLRPVQPILPPIDNFADVLNADAASANTSSAFENLFALWDRDYSAYSGDTACTKAIKAGMRCIFGRGDLNSLLKYNRPAVLELRNQNGQAVFSVLKTIDNNTATIKLIDQELIVPTNELQQTWSGSYILLWKPPFPENESLAKGFVGPDVLWLRHQLDDVEGKQEAEYSSSNLKFDDQLVQRVIAFQAKQGLQADGIVGRETFIELINVNGANAVPKLNSTSKG